RVGFEGSTNWSASGEGTFVVKGKAGGPGYKAQNNTLAVFTDPDTIARFTAELVAEHLAARGPGLPHRRIAARRGMENAASDGPGGQLGGNAGWPNGGTGRAHVGVAHDLPTVALENASR